MRFIVSFSLLLLSSFVFSQNVQVTGRVYYDVNANYVFDGSDSVVKNSIVYTFADTTLFLDSTNLSGQYSLLIPTGSYDFSLDNDVNYQQYQYISSQHGDYATGGPYVMDFAYQPLPRYDSLQQITAIIQQQGLGDIKIPAAGGTQSYQLTYGYNAAWPEMNAKLILNYNSGLILNSTSLTPTSASNNKLEWDFPNLAGGNNNTIDLSFSFPPTGDTIGGFILSPKFIQTRWLYPVPYYDVNEFRQSIDRPATLPVGPSNGVKWLRQFLQSSSNTYHYADCYAVDTALNGTGYFIAGSITAPTETAFNNFRRAAYIAKINKDGLSIWNKNIDSLSPQKSIGSVNAIKHTADGGCVALAPFTDTIILSSSSFFVNNGVVVAKYDSVGNMVWRTLLDGSKNDEPGPEGIAVLTDGSIMITGNTVSNNGSFVNGNADTSTGNLFISKLSAAGNILFTKVLGGSRDDRGFRIIPIQNGSLLVLGATISNDGDVTGAHQHLGLVEVNSGDTTFSAEAWIINMDANGNILWKKCYGGTKESYLVGAADNGSGILLTGFTNSKDGDLPYYPEQGASLWALQVSPATGAIIWSKLHKFFRGYQDSNYVYAPFDFYENIYFSNLRKTKDGNFVVGGTASAKYGTLSGKHGDADFSVVKINTTGDILWQKAIGGTGYDYLNDIQLDRNDDVLFVGSTYSDNDDLYVHVQGQSMVVGKIGITNIIRGQVFIDNNGNNVKDATERYYSQGSIISVKRTDTIAARIFEGKYVNNVDTGTYVSRYKAANNYYTIFPATKTSAFATFDLSDSFDFALTPKPNINDLEIQLIPLSTPRPGFSSFYTIITKNVGTTTISNVLIGLKKDSRSAFVAGSRPQTGASADSLWWGPFTLNAFGTDTLQIELLLNPPPSLNNGDTIATTITANPVANDSSIANNKAVLKQLVKGSFDPNDKTEIHGGTLTTTQYAGGDYLQYLIRFQNTGTDTAFFITIKDTLQSKVDLSTLEVLAASNPFTFRLEGNVATWDFKKINLPDSTTDEPGSHGYVLFKVKPKTGLNVGETFTNNAAIYFDYNLPVITNQDKTIIGSNIGICPLGNTSFAAGIAGSTYQWQVNTGTGFTNLTNAGQYSNVTTATLLITAAPASWYGYRYRCVVNGGSNSPEYTLKFTVQWKGTVSTAWENAANWSCGVLPDTKTDVIINSGSPRYPVVSSNPSCNSLRLSPGAVVTVGAGFRLSITGRTN